MVYWLKRADFYSDSKYSEAVLFINRKNKKPYPRQMFTLSRGQRHCRETKKKKSVDTLPLPKFLRSGHHVPLIPCLERRVVCWARDIGHNPKKSSKQTWYGNHKVIAILCSHSILEQNDEIRPMHLMQRERQCSDPVPQQGGEVAAHKRGWVCTKRSQVGREKRGEAVREKAVYWNRNV